MRFNSFAKKGLGVGFVKASAAVFHLLMNALLARLLSPTSMGEFLLITSIAAFAGVVGQFGLNQVVVRTLSYARGKNDRTAARSIVLDVVFLGAICGLLVASALYLGIGNWLADYWLDSPIIASLVPQLAAWSFLVAIHSLMAESLRGLDHVVLSTVFDTTRPLAPAFAMSAVLFPIWLSGGTLPLNVVMLYTLGCYTATLLLAAFLLAVFTPKKSGPSQSKKIELLRASWPLMIHQASWIGVNYSTLWILAAYQPKMDVAFFGTAFLFAQIAAFPLVVMYATVSPKIAEMFIQGRISGMEKLLRTSATITAIPGLVILGLVMLFGDHFLSAIFGDSYLAAYPLLLMFIPGQALNLWAGSAAQTLAMTGNQRLLMIATIAAGVTTVILALMLVRSYGSLGVAIAYSAGLALQNLVYVFAVRATLGVTTYMYLFPVRSKA